jgi:hypothetical protein
MENKYCTNNNMLHQVQTIWNLNLQSAFCNATIDLQAYY